MHLLFAWRYFRGKYNFQAIQIIAWVSVVAIAVGTAALIIVLSVSNGFTEVVKGLYADFYADVRVTPAQGKFFSLSNTHYQNIINIDGVKAVSKVVENRALLVKGELQAVVLVKGVDKNYSKINNVARYMKRGQYIMGNLENPIVLLGIGVEQKLGLFRSFIGDTLQLFAVNRSGKGFTNINQLNSLTVVQGGAFSVQQEFDDQYVFTNYPFAQYLFDLDSNQYSAIEIAVEPSKLKAVIQSLSNQLDTHFQIKDKYQQNADLYKIMQMEKWIIFAILALIMIVASFNLVGALTMLVLEKQKDIAILKAMGAGDVRIRRIFLLEGLILGVMGGGTGMLLAVIICKAQIHFKLLKLGGSTFIIDYYPVAIRWTDLLLVGTTILAITLVAAWIPAYRAGKRSFSLKSTG